jgi:hypothetical protein
MDALLQPPAGITHQASHTGSPRADPAPPPFEWTGDDSGPPGIAQRFIEQQNRQRLDVGVRSQLHSDALELESSLGLARDAAGHDVRRPSQLSIGRRGLRRSRRLPRGEHGVLRLP